MKELLPVVENIYKFISGIGFDVVIIISLGITTEILKNILKENKIKISPEIICFVLGLLVGVLQIIFKKLVVTEWIRTILGYPALTIGFYRIAERFIWRKNDK